MNENSYLNPTNIQEESNSAISKLEKDNEAIRIAESSLNTFFNDNEIQSEAFASLRQQMSDYMAVLQAMRTANNSDIADFNILKSSVGDEVLIGGQILEQKTIAKRQQQEDELNAENFAGKSINAFWEWERVYYSCKAAQYWNMAETDRQLYLLWQEKENKYDEIEGTTNGLFTSSAAMRAAAKAGMTSIAGAFQNGVYVPDVNATWRTELADCYVNRIVVVNEDGTITANWKEVEKILAKPEEEITEEEYKALALVYMNMAPEELSRFLGLCMDRTKDVDIPWYSEMAGMGANLVNEDYSEWTISQGKVDRLLEQISKTSNETLGMLQVVNSKVNEQMYDMLKEQRNVIIQRMTLLKVADEIGTFRGEYQAELPTISIVMGEDQGLTMTFCEYRNIGSAVSPTISNLGESTVNISKTKNGTSIDRKALENAELTFVGYFGGISVAEETLSFVTEETTGEVISYGSEQLAAYIAQKVGKEVLGKAVGYIPLLGDIAGFGVDMAISQAEAEENCQFITGQFNGMESALIYSNFDCSVNFVQCDMADNSQITIYAQTGENTADIIARVNEKLGIEITEDEVVTSPNDVDSLIEQLEKENPDNEDRYEEAINNK